MGKCVWITSSPSPQEGENNTEEETLEMYALQTLQKFISGDQEIHK